MGYLYLDLYSRAGKYPGCANFAIKGGRRISETEYQLPVCLCFSSICPFVLQLIFFQLSYKDVVAVVDHQSCLMCHIVEPLANPLSYALCATLPYVHISCAWLLDLCPVSITYYICVLS